VFEIPNFRQINSTQLSELLVQVRFTSFPVGEAIDNDIIIQSPGFSCFFSKSPNLKDAADT